MSVGVLSRYTAQVLPGLRETSVTGIDYKDLRLLPAERKNFEREELTAWLISRAINLEDTEKASFYRKIAEDVNTCGKTYAETGCEEGHVRISKLRCKNEFCPSCGTKGSSMHVRRVTRAAERLMWGNVLGYMVYTMPVEVSNRLPDREVLNSLSKAASVITMEYFDTKGNMTRTHLMGDKPGQLHIHFNVLFPLETDRGKVSLELLQEIRKRWTDVVNSTFGTDLATTSTYYKFATKAGQKLHKIKYVLRPIVTAQKFLTVADEVKDYILSLKKWHNTRWFGKLANSMYKKFLEEKGIEIEEDDESVCPICQNKMKFIRTMVKADIDWHSLRMFDKDIWIDRVSYAILAERKRLKAGKQAD